MIYILLVGLIIQLIYCYYVFDKDIFSPSAIICEVFILSTIACIYNISGFDYDIQPATVVVVLGGNTVFILVSSLIHLFCRKKYQNKIQIVKNELEYINVQKVTMFLILICYVVFSVVFIKMSMSALANISSGDFSSSMNAYRQAIIEDGSMLPGWITKAGAVFNIGTYLLTYVFINNFLVDRKNKRNYLLLLCVLIYLLASVFTAQRTTILLMFIYTLFVLYSLLNRKYQFIKKINHKYIIRGVIIVVAFLVLFGATRGLFGRQSKWSEIDNVMFYTGNSIELLDCYLKTPTLKQQFGEETFRQFRSTLSKVNLVDEPINDSPHMEFRETVKGNYGNVYTAYRYLLHDFGLWSIIGFSALFALFYGVWYEKIMHRRLKKSIDLNFIFYAWFVTTFLFRFSIMGHFFTDLAYFIFIYWYVMLFWKILINLNWSRGVSATGNKIINQSIQVRE